MTEMRDCRGITLIELLVAVSIVGILALALGFNFQGWIANYRIESEVKQIYNDLMYARVQAMQRNHNWFVVFSTTSYTIYEDRKDAGGCPPGGFALASGVTNPSAPLSYPLTSALTIRMDPRGLIYSGCPDNATLTANLQVTTAANVSPDYNCVDFAQGKSITSGTMMKMGSMNGGICVEK